MITSGDRGALLLLAKQILASELQPSSVVLARRLSTASIQLPHDALLIRFIDSDAAVEHQLGSVCESADESFKTSQLSLVESEAVWSEVANFDRTAIRLKMSVPLSAVATEFEKALEVHSECVACAEIGSGMIRMAFDGDERLATARIKTLRANAETSGGTLVIEKAPIEVRREAEAWGDVGSAATLMLSLKEKFDPQGLLSPGKFVAGI
jgi:glycolate oxidase FAD binding subunit